MAHHAAMTATVGTSSALGAATAESYIGMSGTVSEAALVSHNNEHLVFAEETLARSQIMHMAAAAHPTHGESDGAGSAGARQPVRRGRR